MNAYICELPKGKRKKAMKRLIRALENMVPPDELWSAVGDGMNSRVSDLADTIDVTGLSA